MKKLILIIMLIGFCFAQTPTIAEIDSTDIMSMTKAELAETLQKLYSQRTELEKQIIQAEYGYNLIVWMKTREDSIRIENE